MNPQQLRQTYMQVGQRQTGGPSRRATATCPGSWKHF